MPVCDEALLEMERRELCISAVTQQMDVDKPVGDLLAGMNFTAEQLSDPEMGPILRLKADCEAQPPTEGSLHSES